MTKGNVHRVPIGDSTYQKTRIDNHLSFAMFGVFLGIWPTAIYWFAFNAFGSSTLPWKISLAIEIVVPAIVCTHYLLNRHARRLYWEGSAALIGLVPVWLLLGSWWLFYFGFAPIPQWVRATALCLCLGAAARWIVVTWRDYQRQTSEHDLIRKLYVEWHGSFLYAGDASDGIVARLSQRNPFMSVHFWLVSTFGPIFCGFALLSARVLETSGGPHGVFIVLSVLGFPLSQWILGQLFVRTVFFHIYLPLKIEHETGKKVILGP